MTLNDLIGAAFMLFIGVCWLWLWVTTTDWYMRRRMREDPDWTPW